MTSFQKAHHKPEKQFWIKFASNNRIKGDFISREEAICFNVP